MKTLAYRAAAVALLATVLLACESGPRGLFRVGGEAISAEDWKAFLAGRPPAETPQQALDHFARRERIVLASEGLLTDPRVQSLLAGRERELLEEGLLDARLAPMTAPAEAELRSFYERKETQRRLRHILTQDEAGARKCLESLKRGNSFESVARRESTDKKSAEKGGDIGWVHQDQLVLPFARAAFSLPVGKLSDPVQTEYGFHILEVLEIKPADPEVFVSTRAAVEKAFLEQRRAVQAHLLKQEAKAKVALIPRNPIPEEGVTAPPETVLMEVGQGEKISLGDLDAFLQTTFGRDPQGHGMGATVRADMLQKMAEKLQVAALARQEGIATQPGFAALVREGRREILYKEAAKRYVAEQAPLEADLDAFFKERQPSLAKNTEARLSILVMGDIQRLDAIARAVRAGDADFEALVRRESADRETAELGGDIGWLGRKLLMELLDEQGAEEVLAGQPGAAVGPFQTPMGTVLFKVNELREGPVFKLGDVREKVLRVYRAERGAEMLDRWASSLESKYPLRLENPAALGLAPSP